MTALSRTHDRIKARHLPANYYPNRRHRSILGGMAIVPDTVVIHWSAGGGDEQAVADLMHRRATNDTARDDSSYSVVIGRTGGIVELVPPQHAPWANGDGWLPTRQLLERGGFVAVEAEPRDDSAVGAKTKAHRWTNLRCYAICLANSGGNYKNPAFAGPGELAGHRNPASRSTHWEPYPDEQIEALYYLIASVKAELPTLRYVCGHEDLTNSAVLGKPGAKLDPGPSFPWDTTPWHFWGLKTVRFDYALKGWAVR